MPGLYFQSGCDRLFVKIFGNDSEMVTSRLTTYKMLWQGKCVVGDELTPYLHQNYEVPNEWPHKIFKVSNNNHAVVVNYNENWERHCYCGFFCNYALLKVTSVVQLLVQSDGQLFLLNLHITEVFSYDYRNEK